MKILFSDIAPWLFEVVVDDVVLVHPLAVLECPFEKCLNQKNETQRLIEKLCDETNSKMKEIKKIEFLAEPKKRSYGNAYVKRKYR
jgi:hypothetical protein